MRTVPRRILIAAAVVVAVLIGLLAALPRLLDLESLRRRILASAEASLHRKVEAGAIRLQIFSGLGAGLENLVVHNPPGWESPDLLTAKRISVKVAFLPLLSRRVEVKRIVLDSPALTIERAPTGALSLDDLMKPSPDASAGAAPPASSAAAFLVSRLVLERGAVRFVDRKVSPGRTVTTAVEELRGEIADVGGSAPARFDLSARFLASSGSNLSLRGTFGPPKAGASFGEAPLAASFSARGLELARLAPYTGAASDPGLLTVDGKADGAPLGVLRVAGGIQLQPRGATAVPAAPSVAAAVPAGTTAAPAAPSVAAAALPHIEGRYDATLDWPAGTLVLARAPLSVAKLPLTLEGRFDGLKGAGPVRTSARVRTEGDVPIDAVTGIAGMGAALPADLRLSGRVRLDATVEGPSGAIETKGALDAASFGVAKAGASVFAAPAVHATLSSTSGAPMSGRVTAASGTLQKLPFEDLVADWTWKDGAVTLAPRARALGGTIAARVETNVRQAGAATRAGLEVSSLDARRLVESLTSVRDVLSGSLTARMDLQSRGLSWDAISKTARGEGRLTVADAELKTVQLMPKVVEALGAIGAVAGFSVPPGLQSSKFSRLETSLQLADGRLATPDLTLAGRDASAVASGSVGLDRALSYEGRVTLAATVVKSLGSVGRYVADPQGRLALPFRVSGTVSAPSVAIDQGVVAELGRRALARQAGERIGGEGGKILGDALAGDGGGKDPLGGILNQFMARPTKTPTPKPR